MNGSALGFGFEKASASSSRDCLDEIYNGPIHLQDGRGSGISLQCEAMRGITKTSVLSVTIDRQCALLTFS
jgi:hypothetical protein